jgi:hypothetical protein
MGTLMASIPYYNRKNSTSSPLLGEVGLFFLL